MGGPTARDDWASEELRAAADALISDILTTLPWTRDRAEQSVRLEAAVVGEVSHERGTYAWWLVEHMQGHIHHEGESTWPTCPRHKSHPLWLRHEDAPDYWWVCRADNVAIAHLGELPTDATDLAVRLGRAVLDGDITPYDGAHRIWMDVTTQFGDDPRGNRLYVFVGSATEWEDHPEARDEIDTTIRQEAERLVAEWGSESN
jgi:hypothetical protein